MLQLIATDIIAAKNDWRFKKELGKLEEKWILVTNKMT